MSAIWMWASRARDGIRCARSASRRTASSSWRVWRSRRTSVRMTSDCASSLASALPAACARSRAMVARRVSIALAMASLRSSASARNSAVSRRSGCSLISARSLTILSSRRARPSRTRMPRMRERASRRSAACAGPTFIAITRSHSAIAASGRRCRSRICAINRRWRGSFGSSASACSTSAVASSSRSCSISTSARRAFPSALDDRPVRSACQVWIAASFGAPGTAPRPGPGSPSRRAARGAAGAARRRARGGSPTSARRDPPAGSAPPGCCRGVRSRDRARRAPRPWSRSGTGAR